MATSMEVNGSKITSMEVGGKRPWKLMPMELVEMEVGGSFHGKVYTSVNVGGIDVQGNFNEGIYAPRDVDFSRLN